MHVNDQLPRLRLLVILCYYYLGARHPTILRSALSRGLSRMVQLLESEQTRENVGGGVGVREVRFMPQRFPVYM